MSEVIALFREQDTRDELGLGGIRDTFADMLFPATSTIQTRARYFLFIRWVYQELERLRTLPADIERLARRDEIRLIDALENGREKDGIIGSLAQDHLASCRVCCSTILMRCCMSTEFIWRQPTQVARTC
jgi:hypothetical protein